MKQTACLPAVSIARVNELGHTQRALTACVVSSTYSILFPFHACHPLTQQTGPFAPPVIGNLVGIGRMNMAGYLEHCRQRYGHIFKVWLGFRLKTNT